MEMPSWSKIVRNPKCLEAVEETAENIELFDTNLSECDSFGGGKITEEKFLDIPQNWRKYIKPYHIVFNMKQVWGPWIVKHFTDNAEIVSTAVREYGAKMEEY